MCKMSSLTLPSIAKRTSVLQQSEQRFTKSCEFRLANMQQQASSQERCAAYLELNTQSRAAQQRSIHGAPSQRGCMRLIKVKVCTACGPPDGVGDNPAKLGKGLQQLSLCRSAVQLQGRTRSGVISTGEQSWEQHRGRTTMMSDL